MLYSVSHCSLSVSSIKDYDDDDDNDFCTRDLSLLDMDSHTSKRRV